MELIFFSSINWPFIGSFMLNTNILTINPIILSILCDKYELIILPKIYKKVNLNLKKKKLGHQRLFYVQKLIVPNIFFKKIIKGLIIANNYVI